MNFKRRDLLLGLAFIALIVGVILWQGRGKTAPPASRPERELAARPSKPTTRVEAGNKKDLLAVEIPAHSESPDAATADLIALSLEKFRSAKDVKESLTILNALRDGIRQAPEDGAAKAILDFLKSGEDASTHLPFIVGAQGAMESSPTLRTALLDLLPSLDPTAALDVARELMDRKSSPDEYALSLRNMAWNDLDGDLKKELASRLDAMLQVPDWLATPSAGFLEGFDVAVEISDLRSFKQMLGLVRNDPGEAAKSLARASFIALDRMILRNPSLLTDAAAQDPAFLDAAPQQRASLMSRLDLTVPDQRTLFIRYLSQPNHGPEEMDYFAEIFPNGNYLDGHRLVTTGEDTHTIASRQQADRDTLREIEKMSASPGTTAVLARIRERLKEFTDEAK